MRAVEETELPLTDPPILAAAGYIAILAYPDNAESRDELVAAIMAYMAKGAKKFHGDTRTPDEWRKMPARSMRSRMRKAQNIIWFERFPALLAANEVLLTRMTKGRSIQFHGHAKILSACEKFAPYSQQKSHFYERAWLPSKQIFHLISPFYRYWTDQLGGRRLALARFVSRDPGWVVSAVSDAEKLEKVYVEFGLIREPTGALAKRPQVHVTLSEPISTS